MPLLKNGLAGSRVVSSSVVPIAVIKPPSSKGPISVLMLRPAALINAGSRTRFSARVSLLTVSYTHLTSDEAAGFYNVAFTIMAPTQKTLEIFTF